MEEEEELAVEDVAEEELAVEDVEELELATSASSTMEQCPCSKVCKSSFVQRLLSMAEKPRFCMSQK